MAQTVPIEIKAADLPEVKAALATVKEWKRLALHALNDLELLGAPIEDIVGVTPEVLAEVEQYGRNMTTFS